MQNQVDGVYGSLDFVKNAIISFLQINLENWNFAVFQTQTYVCHLSRAVSNINVFMLVIFYHFMSPVSFFF